MIGASMAKQKISERAMPKGRALLPRGTRRKDGLVLGTKSKAQRVDRAERKRAAMYSAMEAHPESAEELLTRAAAAAKRAKIGGDPLNITGHSKPNNGQKARTAADARALSFRDSHVDSPTVPGAVERLQRTVDTLFNMVARKQIDDRQYRAAERLRNAHMAVYGSVLSAMDMDRVRVATGPAQSVPLPWMNAAQSIREAKLKLYAFDHEVVLWVAVVGLKIEECVGKLGKSPRLEGLTTRSMREEIGRALRNGLSELADLWGERESEDYRRLRSHMEADAKPTGSDAEAVPQARAVHATGSRIFRTG